LFVHTVHCKDALGSTYSSRQSSHDLPFLERVDDSSHFPSSWHSVAGIRFAAGSWRGSPFHLLGGFVGNEFALVECIEYNVWMQFEWDPRKASANLKKHQVSFEEAASVFYDDFAIQFFDDEHSSAEERFLLLGLSSGAKLLLVCHCERDAGTAIRIISARKATKLEASHYQGGHHES
jgi:uncharacterized protein